MATRIDGIGVVRTAQEARGAWTAQAARSWARDTPWAGFGALVVAAALWVTVIAGVAAPLGEWLGGMEAAARPAAGVADEAARVEEDGRLAARTGAAVEVAE